MLKRLFPLVMFVLGVGLLWLMSRGIQWDAFFGAIRSVNGTWLVFALLLLFLSCLTRVWRWSWIVRAVRPDVSYRSLFSATQIGFLGNFVLPGRIGELIRAIVLTRLTGIPVSQGIALVALDRVTDLFGLMGVMVVALTAFQPEGDVSVPAEMLGLGENPIVVRAALLRTGGIAMVAALACLVALLVLLYARQQLVLRCSDAILGKVWPWLAAKVHRLFEDFAQGLHVFRSAADMARAIGMSLVTWGLLTGATAAACAAFRLDWPWYTPFVIQTGVALFISVPGAPGFIGQFHVPIVAVLLMVIPTISLDISYAFAWVVYLMNLLLVVALGMYSLRVEGMGLMELRRQGQAVREEDGTDTADILATEQSGE
jgi:glycosyltransferase 2 family protein